MVDLAGRSKLLLDSVDAYLLTCKSIINKRRKTVIPVLLQREQIAEALARRLIALGLEKRTRQLSLADALAQRGKTT